jgi:hypothetical protein
VFICIALEKQKSSFFHLSLPNSPSVGILPFIPVVEQKLMLKFLQ